MAIVTLQNALDFLGITVGYFQISAVNDGMNFTSSEGGPVDIDLADGTYDGDDLATELTTKMNANTTLTGSGTITFAATYSTTTKKFTIDATVGNTIAYDHSESDAGLTLGFNEDAAAAQTITSNFAAGDPTAIVTTIKDGVEAYIQGPMLRRTFASTSYALQRYNGSGHQILNLKQYPIISLDRVAIGARNGLKIRNTNLGTSASVSTTTTGIRLVKDGTADVTCLFASYATLTLIAAAVSAISGWEAEVIFSSYNSFKSSDLFVQYGGSAINNNWVYLDIPEEAQDDVMAYPDEGQLYRPAIFPRGHQNVFVDFTAGYSTDDMPEDIKMGTLILIKYLYQKRFEETFGVDQYGTGGVNAVLTQKGIPAEARQYLMPHKRYRF